MTLIRREEPLLQAVSIETSVALSALGKCSDGLLSISRWR